MKAENLEVRVSVFYILKLYNWNDFRIYSSIAQW